MTGNRQETPTTVAFPSRMTPSFLFSYCTLCAGGTRVKRPLKDSRELLWWFHDGACNCYF